VGELNCRLFRSNEVAHETWHVA